MGDKNKSDGLSTVQVDGGKKLCKKGKRSRRRGCEGRGCGPGEEEDEEKKERNKVRRNL